MAATLTVEEQQLLGQVVKRLRERFRGQLNAETIERFVLDSAHELGIHAKTTRWVPLLAERFATDRLRALLRLESPTGLNPAVLFLCVHNAGRSQMAAGFMRDLSQGRVEVYSGGSEPADSLNQVVVAAMAERGIDIASELPQPWADEIIRAADVVVTMGCGDTCPVSPGKRYVDWELEDPAGKPIETVRTIRDEIERRVVRLLEEVTGSAEKTT